jgi:hypothetical protein
VPVAPRTSTSFSTRACWIMASSTEYGSRIASASAVPVVSPFTSVFNISCASVSG